MNEQNEVLVQNTEVNSSRKGNKVLKVIITIVLAILLFGGGVLVGTLLDKDNTKKEEIKETDKKEENNEKDKEEIKDNDNEEKEIIPLKDEKFKFKTQKTSNFILNGETKEILAYYYLNEESYKDTSSEDEYKKYYLIRREVFVDGKQISDDDLISVDEVNNADEIIKKDVINNIKTFKDTKTNEEYYVLSLNHVNGKAIWGNLVVSYLDWDTEDSYILSKEGNLLTKLVTKSSGTSVSGLAVPNDTVKDRYTEISDSDGKKYAYPNNKLLDVHETYIYYLDPDTYDSCNMNEFKLFVSNGILYKEFISRYDYNSGLNSAGQCA